MRGRFREVVGREYGGREVRDHVEGCRVSLITL